MNYREMLTKFNEENKYRLLTLMVADEVECVIENINDADNFNRFCALVEDAYLHTDCFSINQIALTINNAINNDDYTLEMLEDMSVWDLLDKVNNMF